MVSNGKGKALNCYLSLCKESVMINTCFCFAGDVAEFGEWRREQELIAPPKQHVSQKLFLEDFARARKVGESKVPGVQPTKAPKPRRERSSRRAPPRRKDIGLGASAIEGRLQLFRHLERTEDHILVYRESKCLPLPLPAPAREKPSKIRISSLAVSATMAPSCNTALPTSEYLQQSQCAQPPHNSWTPSNAIVQQTRPPAAAGGNYGYCPWRFPTLKIPFTEKISVKSTRKSGKITTYVRFEKIEGTEARNVDSSYTFQDMHTYTERLRSARVQSTSKTVIPNVNLQGLLRTDVLSAVSLGCSNTSVADKNHRQLDTHTFLPKLEWEGPSSYTTRGVKSAPAIGKNSRSVLSISNCRIVTTASTCTSSSKTCRRKLQSQTTCTISCGL